MSETFKFKNFTISQERCAMKVGTDGVLLGAWANGGNHILDIGSGTGLISLMMAQRFPSAEVEGVEIDTEAARQSMDNISASPYSRRINVYNTPLQDFVPNTKYDSIVTNPPFFVDSLVSPSKSRTMARHTNSLNFADIFSFASLWLTDDGEFSAIIPAESFESFSTEAFAHGMFLSRQYDIKTVERKPIKRILLSFGKCRKTNFERKTVVLCENGGHRSEWYENITKDFYIK